MDNVTDDTPRLLVDFAEANEKISSLEDLVDAQRDRIGAMGLEADSLRARVDAAEAGAAKAAARIADLEADLAAAREVKPSGVPVEDVRAYRDAVAVFVSSGGSNAVAAWRRVKVAQDTIDAALSGA